MLATHQIPQVLYCKEMAIERELIFANGTAYNITDTIHWVEEIKDRIPEEDFPQSRFEDIIATLVDQRYNLLVDLDDFIAQPFSDILVPLDIFLRQHGVIDSTIAHFNGDLGTIGTFSASDESSFDPDEAINSDEEEEIVTKAHFVFEMD